MGHASVLQVGREWIVQWKSAAVAMEIVLFQTRASVMKVGWAQYVRCQCSAQTRNAAIMAIANSDRAIAMEVGQGIFAINHLRNAGAVLQELSVIAHLVLACVACHPVQRKAKAKVRVMGAVARAKEKRKVAIKDPLSWGIFQAKPMRKTQQKQVQMPKPLIWRGIATRPMVTGTKHWVSVTVMACGMANTVS